jgi:hypothetical protein
MDREKLIEKIIFECIAGEGFLSQLRARNFLPDRLSELLDALKEYKQLIKNDQVIEKAVAYSVYSLDYELTAALDYFPKNEEERSKIENAIEMCTPLVHEILAPEWMRGPLPDKYR